VQNDATPFALGAADCRLGGDDTMRVKAGIRKTEFPLQRRLAMLGRFDNKVGAMQSIRGQLSTCGQ
jgi:hypothetical protein